MNCNTTNEIPMVCEVKINYSPKVKPSQRPAISCAKDIYNRPEEDLLELKTSIANFGIIQPVTLRPKGETYEIVCGERRYRASLMAGLPTIPAIIRDYSDEEAMEICILENLQRRDINPVEEAVSFGKLMEVRGRADAF
jgi:ParB/RepB/Spo0J family partition protein